jgi:queuine tRNA-ribosyltransferase
MPCKVTHQHKTCRARITEVSTAHGTFITPMFMPVGTRAAVNCMDPEQLKAAGSEIILGGNTYHMLVAPGMDVIESLGGMHNMMHWDGPMLTDSGGFQVFSLSKSSDICKIDENGARFKHPINGQILHLNARTSIEAQRIIGADIVMAFDQCTPEAGGRTAALAALERTHRWLKDSKAVFDEHATTPYGHKQELFGIIQGGSHRDLREQSTEFMLSQDLDGIAIGGEVIGFDMQKTAEVLDWVIPMLPDDKTRYTMGVGLQPQDLIDVVKGGVDIFDCVAPTRNARHGALYHGHTVPDGDWVKFVPTDGMNRLVIKKACYAKDDAPLLAGCTCYTCQHFSRGTLHFLFKSKQALFHTLACIHNVHVMQDTCRVMREVIAQNVQPNKSASSE